MGGDGHHTPIYLKPRAAHHNKKHFYQNHLFTAAIYAPANNGQHTLTHESLINTL